jgi:hypothetical protein
MDLVLNGVAGLKAAVTNCNSLNKVSVEVWSKQAKATYFRGLM